MKSSIKTILTKLLAVALSVTTVLLTVSNPLDTIVLASGYSATASSTTSTTVTSGYYLAEVYTASESYEKLDSITFSLNPISETVTYTVMVYQNVNTSSDPMESGVLVYKSTEQTATESGAITHEIKSENVADGYAASVYLASGESAAVVIQLTSSDGVPIYYYSYNTSSTGSVSAYKYTGSYWDSTVDAMMTISCTSTTATPSDVEVSTSISVTRTISGKSATSTLTAVANQNDVENSKSSIVCIDENDETSFTIAGSVTPELLRTVSYASSDTNVAEVDDSGKVSVKGVGKSVITVSSGSSSVYIEVIVLSTSLNTTSYTYSSSACTPGATVSYGTGVSYNSEAEDSQFSTYFSLSYSNNINAGTATATITGKTGTIYEGYSKSITYTISEKKLSEVTVNSGYTITTAGELSGLVVSFSVNESDVTLTETTDYTVTVAKKSASSSSVVYTVTLNPGTSGNYTGTYSFEATASGESGKIDIAEFLSLSVAHSSLIYNGESQRPEVVLTYTSDTDSSNDAFTSYDLSVFDSAGNVVTGKSIDVGTYTIVITGNGSYTGTLSVTYTITALDINSSNLSVAFASTSGVYTDANGANYMVHTGSALTPEVVLTLTSGSNASIIISSSDYTVTYNNNYNIGASMTVTIKGQNNISSNSSLVLTVTVVGDIETEATVYVESGSATAVSDGVAKTSYSTTFTGSGITPSMTIYCGGSYVDASNYEVASWSNNTNVGSNTATAVIEGKNVYEGKTITVTFSITELDISGASFVINEGVTKTYSGEEVTFTGSEITLTCNGNTLTYGTDFKLSYENNINAGTNTATVTATATNSSNYTGSVSINFTISPLDISNVDVTLDLKDYSYTGSEITPIPTLTYNGVEFSLYDEATSTGDFTCAYGTDDKGNIDVNSDILITITGTGNLEGTTTTTFNIVSVSAADLVFTVGGADVTMDSSYTEGTSEYAGTYTGYEIVPQISITLNGTSVGTNNFTISAGNNVNVTSEAYITIVGKANTNYASVNVKIYFAIEPRNIGSTTITVGTDTTTEFDDEDNEYGLPSSIEVKNGAITLVKGDDYYLSPSTDSGSTCYEAGKDRIIYLCGTGNYDGTYAITFDLGKDISTIGYTTGNVYAAQSSVDSTPYIGENHPVVYIGNSETYTLGVDYTTVYNPPSAYDVDASSPVTIVFTAVPSTLKLYGTASIKYYVTAANITTGYVAPVEELNEETGDYEVTNTPVAGFTIAGVTSGTEVITITHDYTGSGIDLVSELPIVYTLLDDGGEIELTYGTDYTLNMTSIEKTGEYTVYVYGKGNYTGTVTIKYIIERVDIESSRISYSSVSDCTYDGTQKTPSVTITDTTLGTTLVEGTDYTIAYGENTSVGTGTITITGMGNYSGTKTINFNINAQNLSNSDSKLVISSIATQDYTGSAITPSFTVTYNGKKLTEYTDYTVSYSDNINPGTATITIEGKDNYTGTVTSTFTIRATITSSNISGVKDSYTLGIGNTTAAIDISDIVVKSADGASTLTINQDYTITLSNCDTPGTGTITIAGCSDYYGGTVVYTVTIIGDLSDAIITMSADVYEYTGAEIAPTITVTYNGTRLTLNEDYVIDGYYDNISVSDNGAYVTISAKSGTYFTGSKTKAYLIKYNLENAVISGIEDTYYYTGSAIYPTITSVKCGTDVPVNLTAGYYTVSYGTNTDTGLGYVTISTPDGMTSKVMGSQTIYFTIKKVDISDCIISFDDDGSTSPSNQMYTGSEIKPSFVLKNGTSVLVAGSDYTVTYKNNIDVSTDTVEATIIITGYNNYTGSITKTFKITTCDISNVTISVSDVYYAGGNALIPTMSLKYNGTSLVYGTDYTYEISGNKYLSTTTEKGLIVFTGIGNFSGIVSVNFSVLENDLSTGTVSLDMSSATYTGSVISPQIVVVCPLGDGTMYTLEQTKDYTVTYSDTIREVGTYQITITAVSNSGFTGSINKTFTVTAKSIASEDITITGVVDKEYTGSAVTQTVTVYDETRGVELTLGTDYTVSYTNNRLSASSTDAKAPTITITGTGNYGDSYSETFAIGSDLSDAIITLSLGSDAYTYNGTEQHPNITSVKLGSTVLTSGTDYTEVLNTTSNYYVDAGSKIITVQGTGAYYGTATTTYLIEKRSTDSIRIVINDLDEEDDTYYATYDGKAITPSVTVYDDSLSTVTPVSEEEYTVTYVHNDQVSSAGNNAIVQVTFTKNYAANTRLEEFIILAPEITEDDCTMTLWCNGELASIWEYTGASIKPEVVISFINTEGQTITLVQNTDYTLSYTNNKNAGTATVTATLKGNYSGSLTKNFIIQADLATAKISSIEDQFYTGSSIIPSITVVCGGNTLTLGEDYTVASYSDNDFVSSGRVIIVAAEGTDYYIGTNTADFNIVFSADALTITGVADQYTYTGSAIEPSISVITPSGASVPFTVSYSREDGSDDHTEVGTVYVTVSVAAGDQEVSLETSFDIIARAVTNCTTTYLATMTYTGLALTPPVYLVYNGTQLVEGEDFTITLSDNINPGAGTILITGIGNYTGTNTLHFNIISANVTSLKGSPETTTSVLLTWNNRVEVTGFEVYSADGSTRYGTSTTGSMSITDLDPSTEYSFAVRSYVTVDGETTYGAFSTVTTNTKVESVALSTTASASGEIIVSWSENTTVTGYEIYRATTVGGTYVKIASVPAGYTGYTDSTAVSGQTYYYKIRGYVVFSSGTIQYGTYSKTIAVTAN